MRRILSKLSRSFCLTTILSIGLWGCGQSGSGTSTGTGGTTGQGGTSSSGGTTVNGTGGSTSSGGTTSSGGMIGTGGRVASGGTTGSGGVQGTGGTTVNSTGGSNTAGTRGTGGSVASGGTTGSGGVQGTGGTMVNGTAGSNTGGARTGGTTGGGGTTGRGGSTAAGGTTSPGGTTGAGGTTSSGGSSGDCVKGQTQGKNVAVCGESFIAIAHGLTKDLEALATAAGSLPSGQHYDDESVSGTWMSSGSNSIPDQYKKAQAANDIKYVVMDGGGNDCMNGGTGDPIITAATALFKQMATDGVLKVVYFFMPDPVGSNWATLKSCLDVVRPKIQSLCEGLTSPKCYYVDLRQSWNGHPEYTSDGIHPTAAGDTASSKQIWDVMVKNCVAQ